MQKGKVIAFIPELSPQEPQACLTSRPEQCTIPVTQASSNCQHVYTMRVRLEEDLYTDVQLTTLLEKTL